MLYLVANSHLHFRQIKSSIVENQCGLEKTAPKFGSLELRCPGFQIFGALSFKLAHFFRLIEPKLAPNRTSTISKNTCFGLNLGPFVKPETKPVFYSKTAVLP